MPSSTLQGWGEPIASWDYSTPTPQVDFTGLGGYRELLIWGDGITTDTAGTDAVQLRLSDDNGSTFLNSNYEAENSTTSYISLNNSVATGIKQGFEIQVLDFNSAVRKPKVFGLGVRIATAVNVRWATRAVGPYNAIRFFCNGGANLSAGLIRVYGRN